MKPTNLPSLAHYIRKRGGLEEAAKTPPGQPEPMTNCLTIRAFMNMMYPLCQQATTTEQKDR